jgi:hypothetical protein
MLFDEYEIYFTSETAFLIFSRVRSEWNKFNIHQQSIKFSVYYIYFAFETGDRFTYRIVDRKRTITFTINWRERIQAFH